MTDDDLLSFAPISDPDPLIVEENGTASISVACAQSPVFCSGIEILVPRDLFQHKARFSSSDPAWVPSSSKRASEDDGSGRDTFAVTSSDGSAAPVTSPFKLIFQGTVGDTVGTVPIELKSFVSRTENGKPSSQRTQISFRVEPAMLYLMNFASHDPSSPEKPQTRFDRGKPILLRWETNATTTVLYINGKEETLKEPGTYELKDGLSADTTLFLAATLVVDGSKRTRYCALTLSIRDPELLSVTVKDALTVHGQAVLAGASMTGDLVTPGVVSAGHLKTSVIDGNIVFTGQVTFQEAVTFAKDVAFDSVVCFKSPSTVFEQGVIFEGGSGDNWYISNNYKELNFRFKNTQQDSNVKFMPNAEIAWNSKVFLKTGNTFKLTALNGIPSNNTLASLSNSDRQQAFWIRQSDDPAGCRIKIENY